MPFRFTIITAARTAWGRRNVIRMAEKFLEAPRAPPPRYDPSRLAQPTTNFHHTDLIPLELIRKF